MSCPAHWRVTWQAHNGCPAGFAEFTCRARARGFLLIRRAAGFNVTIEAKGF